MKVTIEFDEYEAALLRKAQREVGTVARRKGEKPPNVRQVIRGAVRMGIHSIYGQNFVDEGLLDQATHPELVQNDLSQLDDDDDL